MGGVARLVTSTSAGRRRGRAMRYSRVIGAVAAVAAGLTTAVPARAELPPELGQDLVAFYPFDETSGAVVNDRSGKGNNAAIVNGTTGAVWNNGRGLTLPGGNGGTSPAVQLPGSLLSGLSNATIAFDVRLSSTTQQGQVFAFGRTADNAGYLAATPGAGTAPHQALLAGPGATPVTQTTTGPAALPGNLFKHVAVTIKAGDVLTPGRMLLYEDGVLVAANTALTLKPSDVASATSFIGRSANASGQQFRGRVKDFRIYSKELTAAQVLALSTETARGDLDELKASVDLGDTSALT